MAHKRQEERPAAALRRLLRGLSLRLVHAVGGRFTRDVHGEGFGETGLAQECSELEDGPVGDLDASSRIGKPGLDDAREPQKRMPARLQLQ